jgi:TPR repeat protein
MRRPWPSAFLAAAVTLMPLVAQSASATSDPAASAPETTKARDQRIYCLAGWERFLPGDYYACRARYHLQRQHPARAVEMLKEAAYWANKDAQHVLGLAYVNGDIAGIPANRPLGIAWLALAAERKNADYVRDYSIIVLRSSPAEIASASKMYVTLTHRYGDRVAGPRATRRFIREIRPLDDIAAMGGNDVYINGLAPLPEGAFALSSKIHKQAEKSFDGLQGTVSVGVLERVDAPSPALRNKYNGQPSGK